MAPPKYKLTYFDSKGLVEPLRFMFAYKDVPYDDVRITKEEWPALKPKTPFGKVPTLEFDGHVLAESMAIHRYIARELGLYGKTSLEGATIDMYLDALKDLSPEVRTFLLEEDPVKKAAGANKFFTESYPPVLDKFEKNLKDNGGKYYVGDGFTWADFTIAFLMNEMQTKRKDVYANYPLISKHIEAVHSIPQIKAWVERRPTTQF